MCAKILQANRINPGDPNMFAGSFRKKAHVLQNTFCIFFRVQAKHFVFKAKEANLETKLFRSVTY